MTAFFKLVSLFWTNADQMVKLMDVMISKLPEAGHAMVASGAFMAATADSLRGGSSTPFNARQAVNAAADALEAGNVKIQTVAGKVKQVKDEINKIKVPSIESESKQFDVFGIATFLHTDNINQIKNLNSNNTPFTTAATALGLAETTLTEFGAKLTEAKVNLDGLANALNQMGSDLQESGNALISVGRIFEEVN
jgi:hypothetical protein